MNTVISEKKIFLLVGVTVILILLMKKTESPYSKNFFEHETIKPEVLRKVEEFRKLLERGAGPDKRL